MRQTTVARLREAGFPIGPAPDEPCEISICQHPWGEHALIADGPDVLDGGFFRCPVCPCTGTWGVPANAAQAIREYRELKARGEL